MQRTSCCKRVFICNHSEYLDILNKIRKDTAKIIIVKIDGYESDDPVVNKAKEMMTLEKEELVDEWFGTMTEGRNAAQYTFTSNQGYFDYLSSFDSFFFNDNIDSEDDEYIEVISTDFGFDDISFIDSNGELLFYTTTHEGYSYLNKKYI